MEDNKSKHQLPPFIILKHVSNSHFLIPWQALILVQLRWVRAAERGIGSVKYGKFQSDYQARLKWSWTLGPVSWFPHQGQESSRRCPLRPTWGTYVGILTSCADKGGKLWRGNGCWRRPGEERWGGADGTSQHSHPTQGIPGALCQDGKEREPRAETQHGCPLARERKAAWFLRHEALSLVVLIQLMSLPTFFPMGPLVCLLMFPERVCVVGNGGMGEDG